MLKPPRPNIAAAGASVSGFLDERPAHSLRCTILLGGISTDKFSRGVLHPLP